MYETRCPRCKTLCLAEGWPDTGGRTYKPHNNQDAEPCSCQCGKQPDACCAMTDKQHLQACHDALLCMERTQG